MMRRSLLFLLWIILGGCAVVTIPDSYTELKEMIEAADSDDVRFDVARKHLSVATAAADDKDQPSLERHSELGLIEAHIAAAQVRQTELLNAIQQEREKKATLTVDVETLIAKVDAQTQQMARQALRSRLEQVVEKNILEAAAQEELQSHMGDVSDSMLESAQQKVGRELLAMARVRAAAAAVYVDNHTLEEEHLIELNGHLALLEKSLKQGEMAAVWEHAEKSMEQYWLCADDAWINDGNDYSTAIQQLQREIGEMQLQPMTEEMGVSVAFSIEREAGDNEFTAETIDLLNAVSFFLKKHPHIYLHVWISGTRFSVTKARKQVLAVSDMLSDALENMGMPMERVSIFTLTGERPLRALTGAKPKGALLFLPVPSQP
ncbi:MAG: hypothetical protein JXX29_24035 [Deltaproteobacteria bacterium]|nr:hypothetical protein [Deltaproteobacteria bacterium]MBN2674773.1 hypothetical protein [Deltaproteobacteria bacterium]